MVEITYQMVLSTLQTLSLGVGVIYYIMTLQNTRRNQQITLETRQAQLFSSIMDRMDSVEWWTHYPTIRDAPQDRTFDEWEEILQDPIIDGGMGSILAFLNHVGWLVKKGLIDMETVEENIRAQVVRVHEHMTPYLEEYERRTGRPQTYTHLKYLYEHVKDSYYQDTQAIKT